MNNIGKCISKKSTSTAQLTKKLVLPALLILLLVACTHRKVSSVPIAAPPASKEPSETSTPASAPWTLVWSDEFNAPDGSVVDASKWKIEEGGNGWANNELEYYTARPANVQIIDGKLALTAIKDPYTGPDDVKREYTSARLNTAGKFEHAYGRFEARIKIPFGQGIWPAFWLLGNDIGKTHWPGCGEIDIMENIGSEPSTMHGTIHGPGYSGDKAIGSPYKLSTGRFADDYHIYAVEWEPEQIRFYVDGTQYANRTASNLPANAPWVFNHPFFIILDLAVGGNWPGDPDSSSTYPQTMLVDYVRVYRR